MYKIVTLDMDGTLLNSKGEVSEANKKALLRYEAMGGTVTLCSGRSPEGMIPTIKAIGLKSKYHVAMLGNQVFSLEKKYPVSYEISDDIRDEIIDILDSMDVDYLVSSEKTTLYKRACQYVRDDYITHCGGNEFRQGDPKTLSHVFKVEAYTTDPDTYKKLEEVNVNGLNSYRSHGLYVAYLPNGANKFEGVENVALIMDVKKEDIMAMGDMDIDRDMLVNFGFGIAVANSDKYIRDYADRVCDYTNDEDAVARAFYKYIFKEPFVL